MLEKMCEEKKNAIVNEINSAFKAIKKDNECLGFLVACSDTYKGCKLNAMSSWYQNKDTLKEMFQYLMSLEVPPSEVWVGEDSLDLVWFPIDKIALTKDDFINLYSQFQEFIDSVEKFDLAINFDEMFNRDSDDNEAVIKSPMMFIKENFTCNHEIKEIKLVDFIGNDDDRFLCYDSEGNTLCNGTVI